MHSRGDTNTVAYVFVIDRLIRSSISVNINFYDCIKVRAYSIVYSGSSRSMIHSLHLLGGGGRTCGFLKKRDASKLV